MRAEEACPLPDPGAHQVVGARRGTGRGAVIAASESLRFGDQSLCLATPFQPSSRLVLSNTATPNVAIRAPESSCCLQEALWAFKGDLFLEYCCGFTVATDLPVEMLGPHLLPGLELSISINYTSSGFQKEGYSRPYVFLQAPHNR